MAAETFAALFLAHVIADYLLQTTWLVDNKRRPLALGIHIAMVFGAMVVVTLSFSPWFLVLSALHLGIDITKTFFMKNGFASYLGDQLLHISSILLITWLAPELWALSPFSPINGIALAFAIAGGVIFAARGGQFAIDLLLARQAKGTTQGVLIGVLERAGLAGSLIAGFSPWFLVGIIGAKLAYLVSVWRGMEPARRTRMGLGTAASFAWALATALPMAIWLTPLL